MKFEYTVHFINGVKENRVFEGPVGAGTIENVINRYAADGWEYQNTIVNPYVTNGESYLCPNFYLVFRRVKS